LAVEATGAGATGAGAGVTEVGAAAVCARTGTLMANASVQRVERVRFIRL